MKNIRLKFIALLVISISIHWLMWRNLKSSRYIKRGFEARDLVIEDDEEQDVLYSSIRRDFEQKYNLTDLEKQLDKKLLKVANEEQFNILIWDPPFGVATNRVIARHYCGSCNITFDKSKINDPRTKVVVFHFIEAQIHPMPVQRRMDQFYTWWVQESSATLYNNRIFLKEFDNFFNLTMSYKRDSDVFHPYGLSVDILRNIRHKYRINETQHRGGTNATALTSDLDKLVKKKTKLALWVVSNCHSTRGASLRMALVKEYIKAGLDIDLGGKCFPNGIKNWKNENYKFYLSFENSVLCKEYITEKFYDNALLKGTVPIVFGSNKIDYERAAPPNSYIFAQDYTIEGLIDYLNYLNKNDSAYKEYLHWRTIPIEDFSEQKRAIEFCQLCRISHGINFDNIFNPNYDTNFIRIPLFDYYDQPRIVSSLSNWFYGSETKECLNV